MCPLRLTPLVARAKPTQPHRACPFQPSPSSASLLFHQVFISDIRACANAEQEQARVDKELAKIRKKFAAGTAVTGESDERR